DPAVGQSGIPGGARSPRSVRIAPRTRVRGRVGEPIEALAVADQTVPLAGEALEGGRIIGQGVPAQAELLDFGPHLSSPLLLQCTLLSDTPEVEHIVVATEHGEVCGAREEQRTEQDA